MNVYLTGGNKDFLVDIQKALKDEIGVKAGIVVGSPIDPQVLSRNASDCEILIASPSGFKKITEEHFEALPNLKYISTTSVGTEWIDAELAKERNITICNEGGVNAQSVAEHCFGMILDLSKRITEADRGIRENGIYDQYPYLGRELYKKTIGIIGLGETGKKSSKNC